MDNKNLNNSVLKAFGLLEYFTPERPDWGVRELALHIGANKSTIYRLLATLEQLKVLRKNTETDRYTLGLKLFELGHRVPLQQAFVHQTHPILEKVADTIEETVHLGVLNQGQVMMVDKVESPKGLKLNSVIGTFSPVHCTSLGKVLLAFQSQDCRDRLIGALDFKAYTVNTIIEADGLQQSLDLIIKQSYAVDFEEKELGLICVGVPVFNQNNELIAALSAAGPANRFRPDALAEYVSVLQKGAAAIREQIGNFTMNTII